jgi:hypothetical protein
MSSINFNYLRKRYPEFGAAFDVLESWWEANHRKLRHFEPYRIASWRPDADYFDLSLALNAMVTEGLVRREYGVRGPDQTLATEGFFNSPDDIPEKLHGTGDDEYEKHQGNVIPVYREVVAR